MAVIWLHRHLATPDDSKQMPVRESALSTVQPDRDTQTLVQGAHEKSLPQLFHSFFPEYL